jgi:PAS domain S-box-containing protein
MTLELAGQEAILDYVAAGMVAFQGERIVFANRLMQQWMGMSLPELLDQPLSSLFMPSSFPALHTLSLDAEPESIEAELLTSSGARWIQLTAVPITIHGEPALLGTLTDISQHKQQIDTLRRSEQQFKALVETTPDIIVRRDMSLRYLYVSPTLRGYMGRTLEEMVGKTMQDMDLPAGEIKRVAQAIEQIAQTRQGIAMETYLPRPEGKIFFDTRIVPEFDDTGRVVSTVLFSRDITARKHAEEALRVSEKRLRSILEHMPVMLDAFDGEYRALFWNRECERVTGYSAAEILGRTDVFDMLYDETERASMRGYYEGNGDNFREKEWTLKRKDGETRIISWSNISAEIPIPGWERWAVGVDVTERRRVDMLLYEQERLETALEQEHEQGKLRRQMMEIVHHEFRTPLAIIQTSVEMVERYLERLSPEKRSQYLARIRSQIGHLATMLETIAAINDLNYGSYLFQYDLVDLADLIARIIESFQRRESEAHQFDLRIGGSDFKLWGDELALRRACEHLLLNAVKYSPPHTIIRILLEGGENSVRLQVVDYGSGIENGDAKRIFEPFYRGSNIRYTTGGIGLGLTLVKAIVEHHHGSIGVKSPADEGTTVTVHLPRMREKR